MGRPKTMHGRKLLSLPNDLWKRIEDFRFANRFKTEADALRALITLGLTADSLDVGQER